MVESKGSEAEEEWWAVGGRRGVEWGGGKSSEMVACDVNLEAAVLDTHP